MNRPEGISESAWEKARDVEFDFDCDWTADGRRSGEMQRREATILIARAIQSSVEAERAAILDAANVYLTEQYGIGALGHPIDRDRIIAIRSRKGA